MCNGQDEERQEAPAPDTPSGACALGVTTRVDHVWKHASRSLRPAPLGTALVWPHLMPRHTPIDTYDSHLIRPRYVVLHAGLLYVVVHLARIPTGRHLARLIALGRRADRPVSAYISSRAASASVPTVRGSARPPARALASLAPGSPPARCACWSSFV
jgi:hypothetical protein